MSKEAILIGLALTCLCGCGPEKPKNTISNESWKIEYDYLGVNHLSSPADPYKSNVINGRIDADVIFQINDGDWQPMYKRLETTYRPPEFEATFARKFEVEGTMVRYTDYKEDLGMPFSLEQTFTLNGEALDWDIVLENRMNFHVKIGDLAVTIPVSSAGETTQEGLFEGGYLKHQSISGDGSFIILTKRSGKPPYLLVSVKPGTSLEYFGSNKVFIHAGHTANMEKNGTWRQEITFAELYPKGQGNDKLSYGLRLNWADSYDELRDILYENSLLDVRVVPGMTVPDDLEAKFSLHTKTNIDSIVAEYPGETMLKYLGELQPDHHVYTVKFVRPGENMLKVYFDRTRKTSLEFFSTEPVETLLAKRSAFIVNNQQHRNPDLWYDGLFSIWDMKTKVLRGPGDPSDIFQGFNAYKVACDDPVLGIAPYLASYNALFPDDKQIEALEYHLKNYVWGGLQRTDKEDPYPYGIYGVPNWKVARDPMERAKMESRKLDQVKVFRTYDYPHVFMLYYHMYQIAERYPEKVSYLDSDGYLERMWQTARAFFLYPYEIFSSYDIYKWGNYNEMLIPEMIEVLEEKGFMEEAGWLRQEWEKKAKYFIYDDPYPYRSEFATDRTAFESTYALAKYGATNDMKPDKDLWYDKNEFKWWSHPNVSREAALEFMERQHLAGLSVRGWLESQYYTMGSDAGLSYMARMGGWSVLDYGIRFSEEPHDWLQLGYASYLSSFALMNTGRPENGYGYWYPGKENDGAMGQQFQTAKYGSSWFGDNEVRGPWRYDSELNLGMGAVTRMAATILTNDPLFGWIAYGGSIEVTDDEFKVWPKDGVRIRFWLIDADQRVGVELERDGFSSNDPILISKAGDKMEFLIENRTNNEHNTRLIIDAAKSGEWVVKLDGTEVRGIAGNGKTMYPLHVTSAGHKIELERSAKYK